ncbi:thiamine-phosphate kinase [Thermaurantiacus sp.]
MTSPAARGLADDAAVLAPPFGDDLVLTHDLLAEGTHFTSACPPGDSGWKLAAVNLSDLAAMGARPLAALFGAGIGAERDAPWAEAVARGLAACLAAHGCALIGGDTIRQPGGTTLALSAIGHAPPGTALGRAGAQAGDDLWVSGTIGDAGLGLEVARGLRPPDPRLLARYRRPTPRVALGLALRGLATACIDVSDGLLLDAARLAAASGVALALEAQAIPLSAPARRSGVAIVDLAARGDDYELLFTAPARLREAVVRAGRASRTPVARIGSAHAGEGLALLGPDGRLLPLPTRLGFEH